MYTSIPTEGGRVKITREEIIEEIRRIANKLGKDKLSRSEFRSNSMVSLWHVDKLFDSWNDAIREAGLVPVPQRKRIQEDDLFTEMREVFLTFGGICNRTRFSKLSKRYSVDVYKKRFGRWNNVLKAFLNWVRQNDEEFPYIDQLVGQIRLRDSRLSDKPNQKTPQTVPDERIEDLIRKGEGENLEFKSSLMWDYKKGSASREVQRAVAKTLCAFMNSNGGTLVVGVNDQGCFLGLERDFSCLSKQDKDGFGQKLTGLVSSYIGKEYRSYIRLFWQEHQGKAVAIIKVDKSKGPVYLEPTSPEFYIRAGNASVPLNVREATTYIKNHW